MAPVPKRASQRLGHRTKAERAATTTVKAVGAVNIPLADPAWHSLAARWYQSLQDSAQKDQMEPSDWAAAHLVAAEMTRMLELPANAALFGKIWSAMGELMTTEGARRRLKLEVERQKLASAPASVAQMDDYRAL